jgi:hypothetical protein
MAKTIYFINPAHAGMAKTVYFINPAHAGMAKTVYFINPAHAGKAKTFLRSRENQLGERPSGKGREHPPRRTIFLFDLFDLCDSSTNNIPSLRDGHIYNVRARHALPCFLYRSSGRVLPPLAAPALPELVISISNWRSPNWFSPSDRVWLHSPY